jgi:hypothetical protein
MAHTVASAPTAASDEQGVHMTAEQESALAKLLVGAIAVGRIGIGAVATLAPGAAARLVFHEPRLGRGTCTRFVGPGPTKFGSAPATHVLLIRMLGARDLALGVGAVLAARHGGTGVRGWVEAGVLADAVDAVAFARSGPPAGARAVGLTTLVAGASAASGLWAARRLTA